ncbi:MAG TPA: Ig-like domain-containing protein, partial [Vicinamibacterales bacterium]
ISGTWTNIDPSTIRLANQSVSTTRLSDTSGTFRATVALPQAAVTTFTVTGGGAATSVAVQQSPGNPSIAIDTPADNTFTSSNTVHVTGTVAGGAQVLVNGVNATVNGGAFTADVDVPNGAPVIARVTAADGTSATDSVRVTRFAEGFAVKETFPSNDATAVERGAAVVVLFNHPLDGATAANAIRVTDANNANVDGDVFVDRDAITFAPLQPLRSGARYTVTVATSLRDLAGSQLGAAHSFSFLTGGSAPASAPIVDETNTTGCFGAATLTGRVSTPGARVRLDVDGVVMTTQSSDSGAFKFTFTFSGQSGYHAVRVREIGADGSLSAERALCYRISCATPQVLSARLDRGAKTLTIQFSKAMDRASLDGAIVVTDADNPALVLNATNDVATLTFTNIAAKNITLTVKKSAKDAGGAAMLADYTQTFTYSTDPNAERGKGYISGAVYDATNGRPLANARIEILNSQFPILNSNDRGKYAISLAEGAYTIAASATGYTKAWRQLVVPPGAGVVPIDIRLTKRGGALTHGGDTKLTRKVELTLAVPQEARVTSLGGQSLAGLLPLGWSPLAAAEVAIDDSPSPASLPGARLTFFVDANAVTAAAQTLSLVQYDSERDEWRVVTPVVNILTDGRATGDISASGNYALVYADKGSGLVARAGAALQGAPNPCIATPDTCKLTGKSFTLDPKAVLPSGRTVATLVTDGAKPYPSGTAVQAFIDEQLNLADGRTLVDPPFATDLLIYRTLAGNEGVADFHLAPTAQATAVMLRDGVDHIRIVDYPGRIDRGTLLGAEGGRVPGDDGVTVDVPAGATAEPLHASAASLSANELASFGTIAGFHIVAGFTFTLTRATEPALPEGTTLDAPSLLLPARATIPNVQSAIVVEVLPSTPFGVIYCLAALIANGTTKPIVSTELPLDGLVREGRYLVLTPDAPIAYAYGQVRTAAGVAIPGARVTADALGVRDLARLDGRFVI